jgi:hypothetical protein
MTKTFEATVKQVTDQFLADENMRTYEVDGRIYVAAFEEKNQEYDDGSARHILEHTDWGFDYSEIEVPGNYTQLANLHTRAQLDMSGCDIHELARRYYYAILRELND